ncbi:serine O-acetyltransferase [Xenorhabdus innexi]|uniref:Serine O-acetyltransferase n=1 Tax=Xenorhabdus innexi TaxID=290109 RepID=A0A1N6MUB6_9GAMM
MFMINDHSLLLSKIVFLLNKFNINYIEEIDVSNILSHTYEDMNSFLIKDPSTYNNSKYLLLSFSSFDAVVGYRVASVIYNKYNKIIDAKKISEYCKVKTEIEIHPACKIGSRFVIDHGVGTVIGETCKIGTDCYLLQNVILGATHIASNKQENRHPQIGNNVEIAGFVRIFGNIFIGNNVKISPHSIITENIPDNSIVKIKNNRQEVTTYDYFEKKY